MRGATRAGQAKSDVERAEEAMRQLRLDLEDLDAEVKVALERIAAKYDVTNIEMQETKVGLRKSDLRITFPMLLWTPWQIDAHETATPLYKTGG